MFTLITTLLTAGILAGLIQYFIEYKKISVEESVDVQESVDAEMPGLWKRFIGFLREHWRIVAYVLLGIAGAFLAPLINEITPLSGIREIKNCMLSPNCKLQDWYLLVLFGYGIVFGYASVRLLKGISSLILGNISKDTSAMKKELEKTKEEIVQLKARITANATPGQQAAGQNVGIMQTD